MSFFNQFWSDTFFNLKKCLTPFLWLQIVSDTFLNKEISAKNVSDTFSKASKMFLTQFKITKDVRHHLEFKNVSDQNWLKNDTLVLSKFPGVFTRKNTKSSSLASYWTALENPLILRNKIKEDENFKNNNISRVSLSTTFQTNCHFWLALTGECDWAIEIVIPYGLNLGIIEQPLVFICLWKVFNLWTVTKPFLFFSFLLEKLALSWVAGH